MTLEELLGELENLSPQAIDSQIAGLQGRIDLLKRIRKIVGQGDGAKSSATSPASDEDNLKIIQTAMETLGPATTIDIAKTTLIHHKRVERLMQDLFAKARVEKRGDKWKLRT